MAQTTRTFRIFISSTFSDMKEERNALQKYVFPRLRELCMQHGCRFQAIDLRWGVSEEAALDQQTMKICLSEIERSQRVSPRPNFIVLLGDRYGWMPLPYEIPELEFDLIRESVTAEDEINLLNQWYLRDENNVPPVYCLQPRTHEYINYKIWEQKVEKPIRDIFKKAVENLPFTAEEQSKYIASATEQEIFHGVMKVKDAREHVFCFFRSIQEMPEDANAKDFFDYDEELKKPDEELRARIKALKKNLKKLLPDKCVEYKVNWDLNLPSVDYIGNLPNRLEECFKLQKPVNNTLTLCEDIWRKLSEVIINEIKQIKQKDPLDHEISLHDQFRDEKTKFFMGRGEILKAISDYLKGDSTTPYVITGESGTGKSSIMAKAIKMIQKSYHNSVIIFRFIGATTSSSDGRMLIEGLCKQIAREFHHNDSDVPKDYRELTTNFKEKIKTVPSKSKLIIFLDALDQLSDANNARNLTWLPFKLPGNVKIVVSSLPGQCHEILKRMIINESFLDVQPMSQEEGKSLLEVLLKQAGRRLQECQEREVISKFNKNGLPLYLKLAFEEARHWHSYTPTQEIELSSDITGIISDNFLARLSDKANHGKELVIKSLGYLIASRYGLSEDEILDVISMDTDVLQEFRERSKHDLPEEKLPTIVWSRLYLDLEPYLTERHAEGASVLYFYHRQLQEAVIKNIVDSADIKYAHQHLAHYFGMQPLWMDDNKTLPNLRKVSELPIHQSEGESWYELETTLCNVEFIEAKCIANMVFDLINDYTRVLINQDTSRHNTLRIEEFARFINFNSHILKLVPGLVIQQAANDIENSAPANAAKELIDEGLMTRPWIKCLNKVKYRSPCLMIMSGHEHNVRSCAYSNDGKKIVSASYDQTVKIWDAVSGAELNTLLGHNGPVNSCTFSHDDNYILSASDDMTIKVWDSDSGAVLLTLRGHVDKVNCCEFSPDGKYAVSCSDDKTLKLWDLATCNERYTLKGHDDKINSCHFSPDGKFIISASESGSIKIWECLTGDETITLFGHSDKVINSVFSSDGNAIISGSESSNFKLWRPTRCWPIAEFKGNSFSINSRLFTTIMYAFTLSRDDKYMVSATPNGFYLWDMDMWNTKQEVASFVFSGYPRCCAFSPDNKFIAIGIGIDLQIWDMKVGINENELLQYKQYLKDNSPRNPLNARNFATNAVCCYSSSGNRIISTLKYSTQAYIEESHFSELNLWDASTGNKLATLDYSNGIRRGTNFSTGGDKVVSGSENSIKIWSAETGDEILTIPISTHSFCYTLALSPNDKLLVFDQNKDLELWNLETGAKINTWNGEYAPFNCTFSPNSQWIATATASGMYEIRIWNAETGEKIRILEGHTGKVNMIKFSPDSNYVLSASNDKTLRLWDIKNGTELLRFEEHAYLVDYCDFSPDGKRIISASRPIIENSCLTTDGTVRLWDSANGSKIIEFTSNSQSFKPNTGFSPDGKYFIWEIDRGYIVKVWDAITGNEVFSLDGYGQTAVSLSFSPDGKKVAIVFRKLLRILDLDTLRILGEYFSESPLGRSISWHPEEPCIAIINGSERIQILKLENIEIGAPLATVYRDSPEHQFFTCPLCHKNTKVSADELGAYLKCEKCGKPVQLNAFLIDKGSDTSPKILKRHSEENKIHILLSTDQLMNNCVKDKIEANVKNEITIDLNILNKSIQVKKEDLNKKEEATAVSIPPPHPKANANLESQLNINYQKQLAQWKTLPLWKRLITKKPEPPK